MPLKSQQKKYALILLMLANCSVNVFAQADTFKPLNRIKLNLLSPFFSNLSFAFEHQYSKESAIQLQMGLMNHKAYNSDNDGRTQAVFIIPEFRYTLSKQSWGEYFVGPFARYISMNYSETQEVYNFTNRSYKEQTVTSRVESVGFGVVFGQRAVFNNKLFLELYGGPIYSTAINTTNTFDGIPQNEIVRDPDLPKIMFDRYSIRGGFTVGVQF